MDKRRELQGFLYHHLHHKRKWGVSYFGSEETQDSPCYHCPLVEWDNWLSDSGQQFTTCLLAPPAHWSASTSISQYEPLHHFLCSPLSLSLLRVRKIWQEFASTWSRFWKDSPWKILVMNIIIDISWIAYSNVHMFSAPSVFCFFLHWVIAVASCLVSWGSRLVLVWDWTGQSFYLEKQYREYKLVSGAL